MNEKLLLEINRFREISKLPLLFEGPGTPIIDNLLNTAATRVTTLDNIITNMGLANRAMTVSDIDNLVDQLSGKMLPRDIAALKAALTQDHNLRQALTHTSENFLSQLRTTAKSYKIKPAIETVLNMTYDEMSTAVKNFVKKALTEETSTISMSFREFDDSISEVIGGLYAKGNILRSIDEVYGVAISLLNRQIAATSGLSDDLADEIFQSYISKLRTSSKTKTELDKFTASNRVLNNPSRVTPPEVFERAHVLDNTYLDEISWVSVDDAGTPLVAKTATPEDENLFSQFGNRDGLDPGFMRIFQKLVKVSTKDDTISEIIGLLKGGKQMRLKDSARYETALSRHLTDDNHELLTDPSGITEVQSILERLSAPKTPKVGMLNGIFLTEIEPFVQTFREILRSKPNYFKEIKKGADGDIGRFINEDFNKFMSILENKILNKTEVKMATESDIKQLKDKFLRLSSGNKDAAWGYKRLYADLDKHLMEVLDEESKRMWIQLKNELLTKESESSWRWNTWKEIINDPALVTKAETDLEESGLGLATKVDTMFTNFMTKSMETWVPSLIKKMWKSWLGRKFVSVMMTASWKTPKEMQEFLIKRGYAYRRVKMGPVYMSAGGVSFFYKQLAKTLFLPVLLSIICACAESFMETFVWKKDADGKEFAQTLWDRMLSLLYDRNIANDTLNTPEFEKTLPDWYKAIQPSLHLIVRAPVARGILTWIEKNKIGEMETPEETSHREFDDMIIKIEKGLTTNKKIEDEFEFQKGFINGRMVKDRFLSAEQASKVTNGMYIEIKVDPTIKERGHEAIKKIYQDDESKSTAEKVVDIATNLKNGYNEIKDNPIVNFMVKSNGGDFKIVNGIKKGLVYEDEDGNQRPLSELKF